MVTGVLVVIFCIHMHRTLSASEPVQTVGDRGEKYLRTTLSLWYYMEATQQQEKKTKRKVMTNLDSILKSRDITLLTKVCLVKAIVFPVVMYGFES